MLIHPWDSAVDDAEWRNWIAAGSKFGILAVPGEPGEAPTMVPTHFTLADNEILIHLSRPNQALKALDSAAKVALTVFGDYAYIENQWRAREGSDPLNGVPTSYYSAVNFVCVPTVVTDEAETAEVLRRQMEDFAPNGGYATIAPGEAPYGAMLSGIRAVRLKIESVEAKFKFDDHKPVEFREAIAERLDERGEFLDKSAAKRQRERLSLMGEWKNT